MIRPATFELPTSDPDTGFATAAYFRHVLAGEILPAAEETGEPVSVMLMDIDGLLELNRDVGRDCGDEALRAVVRLIGERVPERALVARYGGDEFAVLLPETRADEAFTLAEDIRREVAGMELAACGGRRASVSAGVASYPADGTRDVELMRQADEALYTAKSTGRNKVALPLRDSRMITKTSHYSPTQLERLARTARAVGRSEATLLREALDDLLKKYNDRADATNRPADG